MPKVTFKQTGSRDVSIFATRGEDLLSLARKANVAIDAPCSGNASCGKCRVQLVKGTLDTIISRHLTEEEFNAGWRLSCISKVVDDDVVVSVPDIASAYKSRMKVADLSSDEEVNIFDEIQKEIADAGIEFKNDLCEFSVELTPPTVGDAMPDNERLLRACAAKLPGKTVTLCFHALCGLPDALRAEDFKVRCIAQTNADDVEFLEVFPQSDD